MSHALLCLNCLKRFVMVLLKGNIWQAGRVQQKEVRLGAILVCSA